MNSIMLKAGRTTYKIARDSHCFVISKKLKNVKTGEDYFTPLTYHSSLLSVVKKLVDLSVLSSKDSKTLHENTDALYIQLRNTLQEGVDASVQEQQYTNTLLSYLLVNQPL